MPLPVCRDRCTASPVDSVLSYVPKLSKLSPFRMVKKPRQLSFDDIYQTWLDFCINAEPKDEWQKWYDSFNYVEGVATREMNEASNEIILRKDEIFATGSKTYITAKQVGKFDLQERAKHGAEGHHQGIGNGKDVR